MLFDVSLTSLSIFLLNVKNSIMFSSLNAFLIASLFFSQNNDIIIDSQKDVIKSLDDYQILKFIKRCIHYKTSFYIKVECDKFENKSLKSNNNNNNNVINVKDNNDNKFKNKDNDDKNLKKRYRNNNDDVNREIYIVYIIKINISKSKR